MMLKRNCKPILFNLFSIVFVLFGSLNSYAQKMDKDIEAVKNLELDWHRAYVIHDINLIANVLADDFINLGRTGGRINKQQTLENFRKDSSNYEYCTPFDFEYKTYHNTIIVLCKLKEKGIANGIEFSATYFSHDVFIKKDGHWKCVLASVGKIPDKK